MQGVLDHVGSPSWTDVDAAIRLVSYFETVVETHLTLFKVITNGLDWEEVSSLLRKTSDFHLCVFIAYVALMTLAALNIITGVFVNEAVQCAQQNRDISCQMELRKSKALYH